LTDHDNLFTRDFYLPTGDLRDLKSNYKRSEVIVVTKCPPGISIEEKEEIIKEINPLPEQKVFFTAIEYGKPYHISTKLITDLNENKEVLLVTGIANPKPLKYFLEKKCKAYYMMQYADHHIFTIDDLKDMKKRFESIDTNNKIMLTTEKDAVRLVKFNLAINELSLFVLPIRHSFLFGEADRFNETVTSFIQHFNDKN